MDVKLEKNVPMPCKRARWPFGEMEVGDSFLTPDGMADAVRTASHQFGKNHNKKYSTRKTSDGFRCWRIE